MIIETKEDIFSLRADALVNPVNCVGVAGKGLALEFKKRFPEAFKSYKNNCDAGNIVIGHITAFKLLDAVPFVINFPTKKHWKDDSKIEYIEQGLFTLAGFLTFLSEKPSPIYSVAVPALGCGLGGLHWGDVKPLIVSALEPINITTYIIEPRG